MLTTLLFGSLAQAGVSTPHHIQVNDAVNLWDYTTMDSGWLPSGSFAQIRFLVGVDGETQIQMEGDSTLSWDAGAMTLQIDGEHGSGVLDLDVDLTFSMEVKLDFWVGLTHVDLEESIRTETVSFSERVSFDPWNFSESDFVRTEAPSEEIEVFRLRYDVIPAFVHIDVLSHLQPTLNASYMTSRIETEHGDITAALDVISIVPEIDQAALPVNAIIHQSWESHLLLEMNSGLEVCAEVIGCFDELSITTPFDELVGTLERSFETEIYSHPLPVFGSSVSAIDFGEVVVGESAAHELTIDNPGELQLEASTVIDGTGEFRVFPDAVIAPPGTVDGLIVLFEPETAGPQSADFVLSTNDPARPEVRIHLTGQAMAPPVAAEDTGATEDSGEAEDTGELSDQDTGETEETGLTDEATQDSEVAEGDLKGCGCASGPAPAGPLAWCFGLGWMLSRRRREG